jgi:hypothetical protein
MASRDVMAPDASHAFLTVAVDQTASGPMV